MPPPPTARTALALLFAAALALALFFALRPAPHGDRLRGLPKPVAEWLNQHDNLSNFAAFLILSGLAFRLRSSSPSQKSAPWFQRHRGVLGFFLLLVLVIEIVQHWIPGRVSDWRDVATGWGGILVAWRLDALLSRRQSDSKKT